VSSAVSALAVQQAKKEYRTHFRMLLSNLRDRRNGPLRRRLREGGLTARVPIVSQHSQL
jgi:hypothetical protein